MESAKIKGRGGETLAASMWRMEREEDREEGCEEDGEEDREDRVDGEEDGEDRRKAKGQLGAGRKERVTRAAGGNQTSKRETRALRQTGGGMRRKKTEMQAREEGLGLCQEHSPGRSCLHPLAVPLPSHTGCSHLQGAWGNLELIPTISLLLLESGSHCGETAGSSLDAPTPSYCSHCFPQRVLALKSISLLGLSRLCGS